MKKVVCLECPGCGAPLSESVSRCPQCFRALAVSDIGRLKGLGASELNRQAGEYRRAMEGDPTDSELNISMGFCNLRLKLYDNAVSCFECGLKGEGDNAEAFFYAAAALLKGKPAFSTPMAAVKKAVEYLNAAVMIQPKGIYYLFLSYLKYDFYFRKFLKCEPDHTLCLKNALSLGYTAEEKDQLFDILGVEPPDIFRGTLR